MKSACLGVQLHFTIDQKDSFILPSTIHLFAWNAIKQYQGVLIEAVTTNPDYLPDEGDFNQVTEAAYTLGHRYKENGIQYLYVCCSRPQKRLFFFVTVPIGSSFRTFWVTLVSEENILTYRQFMEVPN